LKKNYGRKGTKGDKINRVYKEGEIREELKKEKKGESRARSFRKNPEGKKDWVKKVEKKSLDALEGGPDRGKGETSQSANSKGGKLSTQIRQCEEKRKKAKEAPLAALGKDRSKERGLGGA